jgi:hypothetical protein
MGSSHSFNARSGVSVTGPSNPEGVSAQSGSAR